MEEKCYGPRNLRSPKVFWKEQLVVKIHFDVCDSIIKVILNHKLLFSGYLRGKFIYLQYVYIQLYKSYTDDIGWFMDHVSHDPGHTDIDMGYSWDTIQDSYVW